MTAFTHADYFSKSLAEADAAVSQRVAGEVRELTRRFPIYG